MKMIKTKFCSHGQSIQPHFKINNVFVKMNWKYKLEFHLYLSRTLSQMDFCGFVWLKRTLRTRKPTTLDGIWKTCQQCWEEIPIDTLQKSLLSWKYRCRLVVKSKGFHIQNTLH